MYLRQKIEDYRYSNPAGMKKVNMENLVKDKIHP